jgi:hypothetical protein
MGAVLGECKPLALQVVMGEPPGTSLALWDFGRQLEAYEWNVFRRIISIAHIERAL